MGLKIDIDGDFEDKISFSRPEVEPWSPAPDAYLCSCPIVDALVKAGQVEISKRVKYIWNKPRRPRLNIVMDVNKREFRFDLADNAVHEEDGNYANGVYEIFDPFFDDVHWYSGYTPDFIKEDVVYGIEFCLKKTGQDKSVVNSYTLSETVEAFSKEEIPPCEEEDY